MKKNNKIIISELMSLCSVLIVTLIMVSYSTKQRKNENLNVSISNLRNPIINGEVVEINKPKISKNKIYNYEVRFVSKGSFIIYTFDVENKGNVDANISEILFDTPICKYNNINNDCSNIVYSLTYSDSGYRVSYDDALKVGEKKGIVLIIKSNAENISVSHLDLTLTYK